MSKRVKVVPFRLDSKGIESLPFEEIKAILRAADMLIMSGGRNMLAKILKGSRDKKLLELELQKCPVYGVFRDITLVDIMAKIDWMILNSYLAIEYDYRMPLLVFTTKGWEIEMDTRSDELLREFNDMLASGGNDFDMSSLKDRNRQMILLLLDKVEASRDPRYVPLLEVWKRIDSKKVRKRINGVINAISHAA